MYGPQLGELAFRSRNRFVCYLAVNLSVKDCWFAASVASISMIPSFNKGIKCCVTQESSVTKESSVA